MHVFWSAMSGLLLASIASVALEVPRKNITPDPGQGALRIKHTVKHHKSSSNAVAVVRARLREKQAKRDLRKSALQGLLTQYQLRHTGCTSPGHGKSCPYVLMKASNTAAGIGNLLPGIVTGFLLALLLDRCLYIDFPLFNDHFAHELDFNWRDHKRRLLEQGHDPESAENKPFQLPQSGSRSAADLWLLTDIVEEYRGHHALELSRESDYSIGLLQGNPYHQDFLKRYFPDGEIFASLSSYLLHPQLGASLQDFYSKHFQLYNIGIQIRRKKCGADERELLCTYEPTVVEYCQVAKTLQTTLGLHDEDVAFFLAADTRELYQEVANILGKDRVVWTDNGIAPHSIDDPETDTPAQMNEAANPGTLESALMDLVILSTCDDMVVTVASSFGWVAAAMGGIAPVHMLYGQHTSSQNPHFYRAISSEPCLWNAKKMMQSMDEKYKLQFQSSNLWMQYSQCHHSY